MRLFVYDTEGLEDELDDFTEATGVEHIHLDAAWSKSKGLDHASPKSLMAAMKLVAKEPDSMLFIDSGTDCCEQPREEYAARNPGKKIAYGMVDMSMAPIVRTLKDAQFHWVMTFRQSDERDEVNGEEQVVGKKGKASKDMQYVARIKVHCTRPHSKSNHSVKVEIRDQRGLGDKPPIRLADPKVADLMPLVERYSPGGKRKLRAHLFGREATGKSGTALRLLIALARQLKGDSPSE